MADSFQLLKDHKDENTLPYCDNVQKEVKRIRGTDSDNEDDVNIQTYLDIKQQDFTQCEMYSLEDSSCKVRFYHNNIDHDEHFKNEGHIQVKSYQNKETYF